MADRQCLMCSNFSSSDREKMKRHVAIVHGASTFSTLLCGVCKRKYYDFNHFKDHIRETPSCASECIKLSPVPLTQKAENVFVSLIERIMQPDPVQSAQFPSTEIQMAHTNRGNTSSSQVHLQEDGLEPVLNRKSRISVGGHADNVGLSSTQVSAGAEIGDGVEKNQTRCKTETDLRIHCRQIILKRQHNNRLTCSICKGSIAAVFNGYPHCPRALQHAKYHVKSPIFKCNLCEFTSNREWNMREHGKSQHSALDQYIDTTADRIDELIELVSRCFDHGFQVGNSPLTNRISYRIQETEMSREESGDQATTEGNHGFNSTSTLKRPINLINMDCPFSNGPSIKRSFIEQSESRNTISFKNQSMTLEKNNIGTKFETVGASKLSKAIQESLSNGSNAMNDQSIKQSSVLPAHLRAQKTICSEKVKKYVKDGKLECMVCHQRITVSNTNSELGRVARAYDHAMIHVRDVVLFECTTCNHGTSSISSMYVHVQKNHSPDQRKFIDHTTEHCPKILQVFLHCFSGETSDNEPSTVGMEGHQQKTMIYRKPRQMTPAHIVDARRVCYEKVKEFIKNGKLCCQLCSQWIVVAYLGRSHTSTMSYVIEHAIAHAVTHIGGYDLFQCSSCRNKRTTKRGIYDHAKKCQKGGQGKFIDRSNQYYREILDKFMICFDLKNTGKSLEVTEQGTQTTGAGDGNGTEKEGERIGETSSALNRMDSTEDTKNWSLCTKCGYKTGFKKLFLMHQKILHRE